MQWKVWNAKTQNILKAVMVNFDVYFPCVRIRLHGLKIYSLVGRGEIWFLQWLILNYLMKSFTHTGGFIAWSKWYENRDYVLPWVMIQWFQEFQWTVNWNTNLSSVTIQNNSIPFSFFRMLHFWHTAFNVSCHPSVFLWSFGVKLKTPWGVGVTSIHLCAMHTWHSAPQYSYNDFLISKSSALETWTLDAFLSTDFSSNKTGEKIPNQLLPATRNASNIPSPLPKFCRMNRLKNVVSSSCWFSRSNSCI